LVNKIDEFFILLKQLLDKLYIHMYICVCMYACIYAVRHLLTTTITIEKQLFCQSVGAKEAAFSIYSALFLVTYTYIDIHRYIPFIYCLFHIFFWLQIIFGLCCHLASSHHSETVYRERRHPFHIVIIFSFSFLHSTERVDNVKLLWSLFSSCRFVCAAGVENSKERQKRTRRERESQVEKRSTIVILVSVANFLTEKRSYF